MSLIMINDLTGIQNELFTGFDTISKKVISIQFILDFLLPKSPTLLNPVPKLCLITHDNLYDL